MTFTVFVDSIISLTYVLLKGVKLAVDGRAVEIPESKENRGALSDFS